MPYASRKRKYTRRAPRRTLRKTMRYRRRALPSAGRGYVRRAGLYGRFRGNGGGMNAELKYNDTIFQLTVPGVLGSVQTSINDIPQGTGATQRIGRKVNIKKIHIRGTITYEPASTQFAGEPIRLMLVLDTQCNGAAAGVSDLLYSIGGEGYQSFLNISNSQRFKILSDRCYDVSSMVAAVYNGTNVTQYNKYMILDDINLKCNIPIEFSGVTGDLSEIRSNNLYMLCVSNSAMANVTIDMISRIRFIDS